MTIHVTLPLKISSPGNGSHGHWPARAKAKANQRTVVAWGLRTLAVPTFPLVVTLTRVGVRDLDDDNLAAAFKSVRDEVARWAGCGDSPRDPITWRYAQRRGEPRQYAVEITVETATSADR
jgi:hypothetical protein